MNDQMDPIRDVTRDMLLCPKKQRIKQWVMMMAVDKLTRCPLYSRKVHLKGLSPGDGGHLSTTSYPGKVAWEIRTRKTSQVRRKDWRGKL
jgi:hypothetical protein